MSIPIGNYGDDKKITLNDDVPMAFACGGKSYKTKSSSLSFFFSTENPQSSPFLSVPVKTIGIDPSTGNELLPDSVESEITLITGGYINWKVKGNTGRLDFRLEMEDGLTATGYANIPMRIFK